MSKILGVRRACESFRCRRFRGLIAASVYNDLSQKELQTLQEHLRSCASCSREAASLNRLAAFIPVTTAQLDQDLWPDIRRAIRRSSETHYVPVRLSWATAVALGLVAGITLAGLYGAIRTHSQNAGAVIAGQGVPLESELAAVAKMVSDRDYVSAYRHLEKAIESHPQSPLAGEALYQLADLAYSKLNWYPEAFEAYDRLIRENGTIFMQPDCISRHELLDEARVMGYAPLYALDAARRAGDDSFCRLESVIADYPGTLVASLAAEDMARLVFEAGGAPAGQDHVAAMERAKGRCTNPVAIARLKLEIGHIYMRELNDTTKARSFYAEVANFEDRTVAALAEGSLAAMEQPATPGAE